MRIGRAPERTRRELALQARAAGRRVLAGRIFSGAHLRRPIFCHFRNHLLLRRHRMSRFAAARTNKMALTAIGTSRIALSRRADLMIRTVAPGG